MVLQIGVKVLLRRNDGRYLFIKRSSLLQDESVVSWDIPGGRIEPDESLADALTREVSEEIGSKLTGEPLLLNAQDIFVPSKDLHVVRLTYVLDFDPSSVVLSDEHQTFGWYSLAETEALAVEPFLRQTLTMIK